VTLAFAQIETAQETATNKIAVAIAMYRSGINKAVVGVVAAVAVFKKSAGGQLPLVRSVPWARPAVSV